jgi:hypothetical protein
MNLIHGPRELQWVEDLLQNWNIYHASMTHMDKAHPAINGRDVVEAWEARGGAFTAGGGAAKLVQEANHALGGGSQGV